MLALSVCRLPEDVQVVRVEEVAPSFHPQSCVAAKLYAYTISHGEAHPLGRAYRWHVSKALDVPAMRAAAAHFVGTHDFTSFTHARRGVGIAGAKAAAKIAARGYDSVAYRTGGLQVEEKDAEGEEEEEGEGEDRHFDNVRTLTRVSVMESGPWEVVVEAEGPSFTHGMVRNIVGLLVSVGQGKVAVDDVPAMFLAESRGVAGQGAPPNGLCLMWIRYEEAPAADGPPLAREVVAEEE